MDNLLYNYHFHEPNLNLIWKYTYTNIYSISRAICTIHCYTSNLPQLEVIGFDTTYSLYYALFLALRKHVHALEPIIKLDIGLSYIFK